MNTSTNTFNIDDSVKFVSGKHEGYAGIVTDVAKGWITVSLGNGIEMDESIKCRAKQLEIFVAESDDEPVKTMAGTMARFRAGYISSVNVRTGRKTQRSAQSAVGSLWEHCDHGQVAQMAAVLLGMGDLELYIKYAHLNNGQMRMNSGNRINAAVKRGDLELHQLTEALEFELDSTDSLDAKHRPQFMPRSI